MGKKLSKTEKIKDISLGQYQHNKPKRANNPQVGLVSSALDAKPEKKVYQHDSYIDPFLSWAGKTEGISFDVDTVSLHIHERIDPKRIIKQVLKKTDEPIKRQASLFEEPSENLSNEKEFDFYGHTKNWSNRLIAGDSLLVMNSLLEKENMAGKVQMIYIDPPYGITYNSNFQPFTNKQTVKNNDDDSSPAEPEMIKAFRDTWEIGVHSYLTYLRDRILLSKTLLHESGSIFIQISEENAQYTRLILDEIFGPENFVSQINIKRASMMFAKKLLNNAVYYVIWYARNKKSVSYNQLFTEKDEQWFANSAGSHLRAESPDHVESITVPSEMRKNMKEFIIRYPGWKLYRLLGVNAQGTEKREQFEFKGKKFIPPVGTQWKYSYAGLEILKTQNRLEIEKNSLACKVYLSDYPVESVNSLWDGIGAAGDKIYVVQTSSEIVKRCLLMTTNPGDLILDITCGSGTTAYVAEQWGRRWITCDTSRVAIQLAKQRLMTSKFDYYEFAQTQEGVSSGFKYKTVPHVTLGSIANNELPKQETLYDQPLKDAKKIRVTGPFTVEAVPGIRTKPIDGELPDVSDKTNPTNHISEKLNDYLDSIRLSGIRSYHNEGIIFNSVEIAEGFNEIHALGNIDNNGKFKKCAIVFGPDYASMEQTQIERTMEEIRKMAEKPQLVIFCSYAFDPEASKDIDNIKIEGLQILKAQMNTDLLTKDLKKKTNTNKPFWLIGEPDIEINKIKDNKYQVEIKGFDYYDPSTQELKAGSTDKIAVWMLDTDYDNRSLFPSQIFFPMQDDKRDWTKLAKALNGNVDEELLEQYTGTVSIPFVLGDKKTIAVKIVDDRGVEMLIVKKL